MRSPNRCPQGYHPFETSIQIERTSPDGKLTVDMLVTVSGVYDPGCAAVPCSDPDHPAYSDPSSPSDIEVHDITSVEYIEFNYQGESSKDDSALFDAIEKARDDCAYWRRFYREVLNLKSALSKERRKEHQDKADDAQDKAERWEQLAGGLEELLACRHGLGPWNDLELTGRELVELERYVRANMKNPNP